MRHSNGVTVDKKIENAFIQSYARLKFFAMRYEKNASDIEDIIQNTFLEALKYQNSFEGRSTIDTWLHGIMRNTIKRHIAFQVSQSKQTIRLDAQEETKIFCFEVEDESWVQPEDIVYAKQILQNLSVALKEMSQDIRTTFDLVFIDELSYQNAASILNIPVGTVKSRTNRIRKLLRAING